MFHIYFCPQATVHKRSHMHTCPAVYMKEEGIHESRILLQTSQNWTQYCCARRDCVMLAGLVLCSPGLCCARRACAVLAGLVLCSPSLCYARRTCAVLAEILIWSLDLYWESLCNPFCNETLIIMILCAVQLMPMNTYSCVSEREVIASIKRILRYWRCMFNAKALLSTYCLAAFFSVMIFYSK